MKINKKRRSLKEYLDLNRSLLDKMTIQIFHFNPIMVNTLVLHDENGDAIIVDPGNCATYEDERLDEYIRTHSLTVKAIINTHPHIDHIAGNAYCVGRYNAPLLFHEASMPIYRKARAYAAAFGIPADNMPEPTRFLNEGDTVKFGDQSLSVLYTPGHCDGSITLHDASNKFLICGDLLFEGSVGRADLPTGDMSLLLEMVRTKILTLDDDTVIYPGHGDNTTVGNERKFNPFLQ
jgi:glyoxylase-like metal-dependent hydrolase (beta-lactamase superfamily II)